MQLTARYSASARLDRAAEQRVDPRRQHAGEGAPATDHVLPHPALRLVEPQRLAVAERRAPQRLGDPVLVQPVTAFVHRAVQAGGEVRLLPARRDPHVAGADPGRERVHRVVHPPAACGQSPSAPPPARRARAAGRPGTRRGGIEGSTLARCSASVAISGTSSRLELIEQRPHLRRTSCPARSRRAGRRRAPRTRRSSRRTGGRARGCG